ncbi:MAG: hypothetical protein IPJ06_05730 [Saprospiraceae bacterium]|nr:hypothetical protein [Saprospiraceae bacterium]
MPAHRYKLTHRDMGPVARAGPEVPEGRTDLAGSVPAVNHNWLMRRRYRDVERKGSGRWLDRVELVSTARASASTYRGSDMRGGANGARIRLAPQKFWAANDPAQLSKVLNALEGVQREFNGSATGGKKISLADLIVLGGCAAVEQAAADAGMKITVPFTPGRTDATQEQTDVESFAFLEPQADGFRNFQKKAYGVNRKKCCSTKPSC